MIRKKVPVVALTNCQEMTDEAACKSLRHRPSLRYPENRFLEPWALAALKALDVKPLDVFPYDGRNDFYDGRLFFPMNLQGRFAFKTLEVDSFYSLLEGVVKCNKSLGKDFYVELGEADSKAYDHFVSAVKKRASLHPMDVSVFRALKILQNMVSGYRRFKGTSPNSCHPRARYLNGRFGLILGGKHYMIPRGVFFTFGYRADSSSWDLKFLGSGTGEMHYSSSKENFYKAILDCWNFLDKETEVVDPWANIWEAHRRLKRKCDQVRFCLDERSHRRTGYLVGVSNGEEMLYESLLPEQLDMLTALSRARLSVVGKMHLAFVPIDTSGKGSRAFLLKEK